MANINRWWEQSKLLVAVGLLVLVAGFLGAQWQQRVDAEERGVLIDRFPKVRAAAAASATEAADAKYSAQIAGLKAENETLRASQELIAQSVNDTREISAYTLRFLGDRARISDARNAAVLKQTREATKKIDVVAEKQSVVEQTAKAAAAQSAEAASAAKEVRKDLRTAVQPPLPPQPWAGNRK